MSSGGRYLVQCKASRNVPGGQKTGWQTPSLRERLREAERIVDLWRRDQVAGICAARVLDTWQTSKRWRPGYVKYQGTYHRYVYGYGRKS